MRMEDFCKSLYYGSRADMQFKFLALMSEEDAADAVAAVLAAVGEALDTGDLAPVRDAVYAAQVAAYGKDAEPMADDAPFTPVTRALNKMRLVLMSAGGVFRVRDDPMGQDGPTQQESLALIKDFMRGTPTLSTIPWDTPNSLLTARHPGYDARTAQRDPGTVFPLAVLRDLQTDGVVTLARHHYAFTGATSHVRLRSQAAPEWVERLQAEEVDACLLVAT
jgi:Glycine/sarcosine/betaine reductase selenoprotein B (GRDB)